jgi:hypothetical protein
MKAERRHELHQNTLASFLIRLPEIMREHGSKVLLVVIVLLLAGILWHRQTQKNENQLAEGWTSITSARLQIDRLRLLPRMIENEAQMVGARKQLVDGANQILQQVLQSDNRQVAAEAYVVQGDLNWTIANLPPLAAATTQPTLQLAAPADALDAAQKSYEKVIRVYSDQPTTVTSARFGLAAICENQSEFDKAGKIYTEIKDDASTRAVDKTLADIRLKSLAEIRKPLYIAPTTAPATMPALEMAGPTTQPAK